MKEWSLEEIESFRKLYKLTRRAIGNLLGVTVSSVYQWERGLKKPSKTARILLSRIEEDYKRKGE